MVLNKIWFLLFNICSLYLYEFLYKFETVSYQLLETKTSDITFMGRDQELSANTPFHFSLAVPLKLVYRSVDIDFRLLSKESFTVSTWAKARGFDKYFKIMNSFTPLYFITLDCD